MTPALAPGTALGALGVLSFSLSFTATKAAVGGLDPVLVGAGRAVVAAGLAGAVLVATRAARPTRAQLRRLLAVAAGVVVGFPLLTSLALEGATAAHLAVVTAVMPAATAVAAVLRAGERPSPAFWAASGAGMAAVLVFAATQGPPGIDRDDAFALLAVVLVGWGYAEGGAVSRELGGARTICWALLVALPVTLPVALVALAAAPPADVPADAWVGFAYVALVSMFLGFFAWYAGLARGGVARVGQLQLAQPVLTLGWAALLLGEEVTALTVAAALLVLASVVATQRARVAPAG
jgi:drug/metabolite transporter (DMT)-like permease